MSKGQFGARDVQKHLWKLPIPEYNPAAALHAEIAAAGAAAVKLAELREQRRERLTVTIVRREVRAWLRASSEGAAVARLLASG